MSDENEIATTAVTHHHTDNFMGGGATAAEIKRQSGLPVYESDDGQDTADEVDPRRLFRNVTPNELRWYYREGAFAPTVVDKPIDDAYKHGYRIKNDPPKKIEPFLERYIPKKKTAEKKARRDGFSFIFFNWRDQSNSSRAPQGATELSKLQVLSRDSLSDDIGAAKIAENFSDLDAEQIEVRETGIVVVNDITHPRDRDLLGVVYKRDTGKTKKAVFLHHERLQPFVWRPEVDGNLEQDTLGEHEGDSVLIPIIHALRAVKKSQWAFGKALFKYASPLYAVSAPEGADDDGVKELAKQLQDLNTASDVTLPHGTEVTTHGSDGGLDPEPYFTPQVDMICANTEFTKSVLLGTQSGTVSGSTTDIKNYFNAVEKYRRNRGEEKIREAVGMVAKYNKKIIPTWSLGFEIEWEPLFKLDRLDKTEAASRVIQATSQGINNYTITPDEAREILNEQWATLDIDIELDDLVEEDWDQLDRVQMAQKGAYVGAENAEAEMEGNPRVGQNGGGNAPGNTTDPNNPTSN